MKKWVSNHKQLTIIVSFLLLSILSVYIVYLRNGQLLLGDDYHFHQNRIEGLAISLQQGVLIQKISYFFIGGYGYAVGLFYPDFYLYFPALLRILGFSLDSCYIIFVVFINFGTFTLTYYSGNLMNLSYKKSYIFSLLYTLSVYRLQDLLNRQAVGEILGMMLFPLVLASINYIRKGNYSKWPLLVWSMTGIGLAHFISLEIICLFIACYIVFNLKLFLKRKAILSLVKAASLTIGLLVFYLLPIAEQMAHITFQVTSKPLVRISEKSYTVVQLFVNSFINGVFHASSANIGLLLLIGLLVYTFTMIKKLHPDKKLVMLALLFMFMTTNLFPWKLFDQSPFNTIQFPWRLLSVVTLLLSYLIAKDSLNLFSKNLKGTYFLCFVIIFGVVVYEIETVVTEKKRMITYEKYDQTNSYYIGAGHEYLPKEVDYSVVKKHKSRNLSYNFNKITITDIQMNYGSVSFEYDTDTEKSESVVVPFIYYYGYQVIVENGKQKEVVVPTIDKKSGLVKVSLKGAGKAVIYYRNTFLQKASLCFSLILLLSCIVFKNSKKVIMKWKNKA